MADSYQFFSAERMLTLLERHKGCKKISDLVVKAEEEITGHNAQEIIDNAIDRIKVMRKACDMGMKVKKSKSGMVKDEALKLKKHIKDKKMLLNPLAARACSYAISIMSQNAVMGTIVAAPTAGSSGIIPGCLLSYQEEYKVDDEKTARALLAAAGIGMIIAHISNFSAAKLGCQAEVGTSSCMAAAAISEIRGLSPEQCVNASALSLKNMLGLACDPIAGLVEVPCVKRNAFGVTHAMTASDLSYSGVESVVPFDEVVVAMNNIAKSMDRPIKETSMGGLAVSKTGRKISDKLSIIEE